MKNLILLLVLANILYFMWGRFVADPPETGIVVVKESELEELAFLALRVLLLPGTGHILDANSIYAKSI